MGDWNHVNGYLIRPELQYAVEAALTLNKPLLLRGEPGTGKTGLAQAAAGVEPEIGRQGQPRSIPI